MKNLKVKSILFSLFAMMAVAVFMTSCEQTEEIIGGDDSDFLVVENDDEITTYYDLADLPEGLPNPDDVLVRSLESDEQQDIDSRDYCIDVIRYKVNECNDMTVDWRSKNNLALFVINPTPNKDCNFRCDEFGFCPSGVNGQIRSVAFMGSGYTTYDSETKYWYDD